METVNVRFIIGELGDEDTQALNEGHTIVSKMILPPDDFGLFRYQTGDAIEAETGHGGRVWCVIKEMEVLKSDERVIIIFTLTRKE